MPLPDRDGIEVEDFPIVAVRRMLSGTLRVDLAAIKARVRVRWSGLTSSERSTLRARYDAADSATLVLPDRRSLTVVAVGNSWKESQFYDLSDVCWYTVQLEFLEV